MDKTPPSALVRKHFVLDTNVLLHDPQSMFSFQEHVVWIPIEVLEELDKFKSENTTRGANAREVHRKLNERFPNAAAMRSGVDLESGGRIQVCINAAVQFEEGVWHTTNKSVRSNTAQALFPDFSRTDNRILATAAHISDSQSGQTILVTKDLNLQLKARSLGLDAQDYRTDRVEDDNDIRRAQRRTGDEDYESVEIPGNRVQAFASEGHIFMPELKTRFLPNQYMMVRSADAPEHGVPARHKQGGMFHTLHRDHVNIRGGRSLQALNLGQRFLLDALYDPEITLVTVYGKAGTGKTLLTVGAALEQVQNGDYEKMLITRVIMPTGKDIGFLPGSKEEKMQPWLQPAYDALEHLLARPRKPEQFENKKASARKASGSTDKAPAVAPAGKQMRPYEPLLQSGLLEVEAITHIRGRSIPRSIFIVDEAQQLTPHEAKTLVTRMGRGSKMVLIGDLGQIDNPYVDAHTNGLVYTRNKLQGQDFMTHVNLFKGERSHMAEVAANLM
ncbi:MAG: PhoH family protein [Verrucomicrobiota bacterium]